MKNGKIWWRKSHENLWPIGFSAGRDQYDIIEFWKSTSKGEILEKPVQKSPMQNVLNCFMGNLERHIIICDPSDHVFNTMVIWKWNISWVTLQNWTTINYKWHFPSSWLSGRWDAHNFLARVYWLWKTISLINMEPSCNTKFNDLHSVQLHWTTVNDREDLLLRL